MGLPNACAAIALSLALSACVVVPVLDREEDNPAACKTFTKSMSLKMLEAHQNISIRCHDEECLGVILASAAVTAGSAVISGSIVLTGNTVHWLEYQGTCNDGILNATKQRFLDTLDKPKAAPEVQPNS